ncbi:MAG: hypothetical protein MJ230_03190 [bacterium]|nr:hypothetical protein [bacterium]
MNEINQAQNLNAYYTTTPKVEKRPPAVIQGPENIPTKYVYSDIEANKKLEALNNDIYVAVKKEPKPKKKFLGIF